MKTKLIALAVALFSLSASAEFRIYRHVPELNFKSEQETAKEEARDAFFVAMQGYTCYLPSEDSYCTVPLRWHNNMSDQVSVWRDGNRLATGYSGEIQATVRLNQSFDYYIRKGAGEDGEVVDAANVKAIYDPNAMTGLLKTPNDGVCDITYGMKSCKQAVSWETNSPIASIWIAKKGSPTKIQDVMTKSGNLEIDIGPFANLYELRAGKSADGNLMASVSVEGKPVQYAGTLALDDGATCLVGSSQESCDLPVSWASEKPTSVWVDNKRQTEPSAGGKGVVRVPYGSHRVVLRPENVLGTDLVTLKAEAKLSDIKASIALQGEPCTIGYADTMCRATATISTNLPVAYLFKGDTRLQEGSHFAYSLEHTEQGNVYTLRQGPQRDSQLLATYVAKAEKQKSYGELIIEGECVFPYKGASCTLPASFKSNVEGIVIDSAGKHYSDYSSLYNHSYPKEDVFNVTLKNDGNNTTTQTFMLKAVDRSKPWLQSETIAQQSVTGTLFENTGTMAPLNATTCNLPSNKETCFASLAITSTSSVVSIWRHDGVMVYAGYAGSESRVLSVPVAEGENTFYLKEGRENFDGSLAETKITGLKIDYYASKDPSMIDTCSVRYMGWHCIVTIKTLSNLKTEPYSAYYLSSANEKYDVYHQIESHTYGNGSFAITISVPKDQEQVKKIIIASGTSSYLYDEKVPGSVNGGSKLNDRILYDQFEVYGKPSRFNVRDYSDSGDFGCTLYPGSTYCVIKGLINYSFNTDSDNFNSIACLLNGTATKGEKSFAGISGPVSGAIEYNGTFYPDRESRIVIKNYQSSSTCANDELYPAAHGRMVNVTYEYTKPENVKAAFSKDSFSCNLSYHGEPSCLVDMNTGYPLTADRDATIGTGNGKPMLYVKRLDNGQLSTPIAQNDAIFSGKTTGGVIHKVTINEGDKDVMVGLMVMAGDAPADNDPMIDTAVINHGYAPVQAKLYIQRNVLDGSLYQVLNRVHTLWYYYNDNYSIPSLNSMFPGIFTTGQECFIHKDATTCKAQVAAQLTKGSASLFLDGFYLGSVSEYSSAKCSTDRLPDSCGYIWKTLDLAEGSHLIQLYDGVGESAKNNPLVAERTLVASRPVYTGSITLAPRKLRNYGASEDFVISAKANRKAYLFRKGVDTVLGQNTLNTYVDFEVINYTDHLSAGAYTYVLGSHSSLNDPDFEVLDEQTLIVEAEVNTIELTKVVNKEFYFNSCYQAVYEEGCEITFAYKGTSSPALSDGKLYASMCLVDSNGGISNVGSLTRYSSFRNATARINTDSSVLNIYDGLECPSSLQQSDIPLIGKIEGLNVKTGITPSATFGKHASFNNYTLNERGEWQCVSSYEGNSDCRFYFNATPTNQVVDGKSLYSIAAWADGQEFITGSSSGVLNGSLLTTNISTRKIDIVVCETQAATKEGCPYVADRVIVSAKVLVDIKPYEYTVDFPKGDTCLLTAGESKCYANFEVKSNSPYISVVNDNGVVLKSHNNSTQTVINFTDLIDLSNNGVHEYKVVTGTSPTNNVMKTFSLNARLMTNDDFRIMDDQGNVIVPKATHGAPYVIDPLANNGSTVFSVPDGSVNYHNEIGPVKLFVDNVTPEQSVIENGEGKISFTSPSYSLVNEFLASAAKKNFTVKLTWLNEVGNKNYNIHEFSSPYKFIGYSYEPYTVTMSTGTSGMYTSTGSPYGTCSLANLCIDLKNAEMNIEGTSMKGGSNCTYCARIPLRSVSFNNAVGVQKQFSVALNSGFTQHRFFYRIVDTNTISDPTVTFQGQVRSLNMDGAWHALEFETMKGGEVLDFSWLGNATGKGAIEFFGRYERD